MPALQGMPRVSPIRRSGTGRRDPPDPVPQCSEPRRAWGSPSFRRIRRGRHGAQQRARPTGRPDSTAWPRIACATTGSRNPLNELSGGCIDRILGVAGSMPTDECEAFVAPGAGKPSRVPENATACVQRKAPFVPDSRTRWRNAPDDARRLSRVRDRPMRATTTYGPGDIVRMNPNIRPERADHARPRGGGRPSPARGAARRRAFDDSRQWRGGADASRAARLRSSVAPSPRQAGPCMQASVAGAVSARRSSSRPVSGECE